jgi:hypothetical protein
LHLLTVSFHLAALSFKISRFKSLILQLQHKKLKKFNLPTSNPRPQQSETYALPL